MREEYYTLIKQYGFLDIFSEIEELPYSKKTKLIQDLIDKKYSINAIKLALYEYKMNYIDLERINLTAIGRILESLTQKYAQRV